MQAMFRTNAWVIECRTAKDLVAARPASNPLKMHQHGSMKFGPLTIEYWITNFKLTTSPKTSKTTSLIMSIGNVHLVTKLTIHQPRRIKRNLRSSYGREYSAGASEIA